MAFPSIAMLKLEYKNQWIDDDFMIDRVKEGRNTKTEFKQITGKNYVEATAKEN